MHTQTNTTASAIVSQRERVSGLRREAKNRSYSQIYY